jgi:transposase-like protein
MALDLSRFNRNRSFPRLELVVTREGEQDVNSTTEIHAPQKKIAILKQHLLKGKAVSGFCDAHNMNPNALRGWQEDFSENSAVAFE